MIISKNRYFSSLLMILASFFSNAQNNKPAVESFENEVVLSEYKTTNSNLTTSDTHFRYGDKSLKWTWTDEASFATSNFKFLTKEESPLAYGCLLYTSPSPRDLSTSRMPSSA